MKRSLLPLETDPNLREASVSTRPPWKGPVGLSTEGAGPVPRRLKIWASLAAFHLGLVVLGASQMRLPMPEAMSQALDLYGTLTGSSLGFNYFAPDIGSELRARYYIADRSGNWTETQWRDPAAREAELRLANLVTFIGSVMPDEVSRRKVAASWAAKVFARHPDAAQARVVFETWEMPGMNEYRAGRRGEWQPFYQATFRRKGREGA